jgi:hypothetical protein
MKSISKMKEWLICSFIVTFLALGCTKKDLTQTNLQKSTITDGSKVKKNFDSLIISRVAGSSVYGYAGDGGDAGNATLNNPLSESVDKKGNIYITDFDNHVIRKIDARTNIITTVAGNGIAGFSGDGGLATQASLAYAFHTTVDDEGNLYISDLGNNRIRKVNKASGIITTIAGTGVSGFNGDGNTALATNLSIPMGIAFDKKGNLLISDEAGLRLRSMNLRTKIITTIAGNGIRGYSGDGGPATQAMFNFIWNVVVDNARGDIYISDEFNYRIRKIDPESGVITTVAGNGILGNSGNGGLATNASFTQPVGIAVDKKGNVYVSDEILSQIYRVDKKTGVINLIAGNGTNGYFGDGGPAIMALLSHPNSLAMDPEGNLFICDSNNNRIRKISPHDEED